MQVVELGDRYDISCVDTDDKVGFIQNPKIDKACTLNFTVSLQRMLSQLLHIYL
jgi:hypothetical protein